MDYKEYLDKARIKQLAELQARYNQVYAKERAEAASSLIAGHRQLRRGLQNLGLAGRKGNLISGREKTAALEARRRYREYNAGLSRAANTFTTAAGQRMARQAIDDENRVKRAEAYAKWGDEYAAAKAEAEKEYAAKLEEAKQEHLQYAQEYQNSYNAYLAQQAQYQAWLQQQAAAQAAAQQSAQQELIDPRFQGNNMQQQKQDLMAARAEQQRIQAEIKRIQAENQRLQMQQMAQDGVDPRLSGAQNTQQAKLQAASAARLNTLQRQYASLQEKIQRAEGITKPQNRNEYEIWRDAQNAKAKLNEQAQYAANMQKWQATINQAANITKPTNRYENEALKEAERARQQMAKAQAEMARKEMASKVTGMAGALLQLSDEEFKLRYDAAERAYKLALQNAKILRQDSSSSMDDLSSDADRIEAQATQNFVAFEQANALREQVSEDNLYWNTFKPDAHNEYNKPSVRLIGNLNKGEFQTPIRTQDYLNAVKEYNPQAYNKMHDTDSKYAAAIHEYGRLGVLDSMNVSDAARDLLDYDETFLGKALRHSYADAYDVAMALVMTDEEKNRFDSFLANGQDDKADKYFEYLRDSGILDARAMQLMGNRLQAGIKDEIEKNGKLGLILSTLWTIPANVANGLIQPIASMFDTNASPYTASIRDIPNVMREAVSQNLSQGGAFAYQTGMSIGDSLMSMALGGRVGGVALGGAAYNSAYREALNRGLSTEEARLTAFGNGINEMLFETLSIGTLLEKTGKSAIKASKSALVNWLVNTAVQAGVEGSEEVFTDIANNLWDKSINGIVSEELTSIREYMSQGMTLQQAKAKVQREFAMQLGMSFLGGALSGGVMAGVGQGVNAFMNRKIDNYGKQIVNGEADVDTATLEKFDYKSEQAQEILNSGKLTNTDYGMLAILRVQELVQRSESYINQAVAEGKMPQEIADIYKKFAEHSVQTETNPDGITDEEAEKMLPYVDTIKNAEAIKQGLGKIVEQQTAARKEFDALSFEQKQQRLQNITNETTALRNAPSLRVGASESRLSGQSAAQEFTTRAKTDTITLNNDGSVKTAHGSVTFDFGANKTVDAMTDNQARAIRFAAAVANKTGVNIKVEQEFVGDDRNKNGEYNPETNTIRVNLSGTNSAIYTMSHELTHYLQSNNKQAFADLSKAIQKQLSRTDLVGSDLPSDYQDIIGDYLTGDNTLWQALCAYEKERYAKEKINLTQEKVEEEVIARCCESFLGNSSLIADMTQNHTKSARAVYRFLNEIRADINALRADASERMAERGYASDFSPEQGMLEQFADIDKIVKLWENGLRKVAKKNKASGEKMASLSDKQYLDLANRYESGDKSVEAELRKAVDAAAKAAGYKYKGYHGTNALFNVFDPKKLGSKNFMAGSAYLGFFASASRETAESYTGLNDADVMSVFLGSEAARQMEAIKEQNGFDEADEMHIKAKEAFEKKYKESHGYNETVTNAVEQIMSNAKKNGIFNGQTEQYERDLAHIITQQFEADWNKQNYSAMQHEWEQTKEHKAYSDLNDKIINEWEQQEIKRRGYVPNVKDLYIKIDNPYIYDFEGEERDAESFAARMAKAKKDGNDGCIFKNVADGADIDTIYTVFSNTQFKSADLITKDDNGNIIPLSERFKTDRTGEDAWKNEDIRYSVKDNVKLPDSEYMNLAEKYKNGAATESETEALRKAVDAAAKAAGYNTKAYHGTRRMFNVFRGANEMGYHFGTKAAAQGRVGRGKAARIIPAYIRANNPIVFDFDMGSWDANFRLADELHEMKVLSVDELNEVKYGNDGVRRFKRSDESANKILQGILKAKGYDSIKYKNTMETKSSWSYIVYDASQAKSADLVTYDSDGNIIPLSERFKTDRTGEDAWKNEDIRYSLNDGEERAVKIADGKTRNGETVSFIDLLLDGQKTGETRTTKGSIKPNAWVGIYKDGKVYGRVKFGNPYWISKQSAEYKTSYIEGTNYDIDDSVGGKWYYPVLDKQDFRDNPIPTNRAGQWGAAYNLPNNEKRKYPAEFISKVRDRNGYAVHMLYKYRGHEYMVTDERNGYSEPMWVKHKNEQDRIDREIAEEKRNGKEPKTWTYAGSAQEGFDLFWDYVENGDDAVFENNSGDPVMKVTDNGNSTMLSLSTYEKDGRATLKDWLKKQQSKKRISKEDAQYIIDQMEKVYNIATKYEDKYAAFGAWSRAEVTRDKFGKPVFSVIRANGEYPMNLDFSLVCVKRRALDAVLNEIVKSGYMDKLVLDGEALVKVNETIRRHGFETACMGCFVEAKRFRQQGVAETFVGKYNDLVKSLGRDDVSHFNFAKDETIADSEGIVNVPDKELDFTRINELVNQYKAKKKANPSAGQTVEEAIAMELKMNPSSRRLVDVGDFMSTRGMDAVAKDAPSVLTLYNKQKGTGGPKAVFGDMQYLNDVERRYQWTPEKAYKVGGVRVQSFSDFVPRMFFDYCQMVADLSAKKLPAHAYTKEESFVKLFGLTGMKINMSLFPKIANDGLAAGLMYKRSADGDIVFENGEPVITYAWAGESFDYETAKQIQADTKYGKNCGTIAVGISDEHIARMLDDPTIRMIIPYHKSSLNPVVAEMMGIDGFTDYTDQQRTKKDGKAIDVDFAFNQRLHEVGDPKAVVKEYLAWCEKNGYTPKFDQFKDNENYYKLLEDFALYDEQGNYCAQEAVKMVYPEQGDAFGSMDTLLDEYLKRDNDLQEARDAMVPMLAQEIIRQTDKKASLAVPDATLAGQMHEGAKGARALREQAERYNERIDELNGRIGKLNKRIADLKAQIDEVSLAERMHQGAEDAAALRKVRDEYNERIAQRDRLLEQVRKQRDAAKQHAVEVREQERAARIRRDIVTVLKRGNDRIVKLLANPTENAHVPVQLAQAVSEYAQRLNELLTTSVPKSGEFAGMEKQTKKGALNAQKIIDALNRSYADKETIDALKAEDPSFNPRGLLVQYDENGNIAKDETLIKMIEGMDSIIQGKHLTDLAEDELRFVLNTMRGVIHTVTDANNVTVQGEKRNVYRTSRQMANEVNSATKVFGDKSNKITKFLNRYVIESLGLRRIAKLYSGSNENAVFVKMVDDLNEGALEQERIKQTLRGMFNEVTSKYAKEMDTWYGKNAEWIDTGFGFKITKGMRVSLAMHILNAQNLRNVEKAGLRIPDMNAYRKGNIKEAYKNGKVVRLTKEQAQQIVDNMTEAEEAYFEVAKEFFHKRSGYYINRTSLKLLGYSKAVVENYFPIQTDDAYRTVKYDDVRQTASVEHPGFLETRKGTENVMYLNDITAVVNRQIDGVAKYAGLAIPMRNWNNIMNAWLFEENEDGEWVRSDDGRAHDVLERRMGYTSNGKAIIDYVDQFITDLTSPGVRDANEKVQAAEFAAKLTSNYVKAVLTLNARVALSQLASVPTAASEIPWKYIAQSFGGNVEGHLNTNASNDLIDQYTPIFAMRRAGTQTEVSEVMKRKGFADKAEQKLPGLLGWITAMDVAATRRLWYACERWVKGETNIPVGSDAFYKEVAKRYERVIQNTQPNFTVLQRSPALRSKNAAARIITMFGTQRMQNGGIIIESAAEVVQAKDAATRKSALKRFGRALSGQITAAIVLGLSRAIVAAVRGRMRPLQDDDKDITVGSVSKYIMNEIGTSIAGSFMYVGEIYDFVSGMVGGIVDGDSGYETSFALPAAESLSTIIQFFKEKNWQYFEYISGDHTDNEKWLKTRSFVNALMTVASYATGLPLANASKTILNGTVPLVQDIVESTKTGELNLYLHQSGKLDSAKTAENYKAWTKAGYSGRDYFYWEKQLNGVSGGRDGRIPILLDSDLTNEQKALMMQMFDTADGYADGTVFYNKKGEAIIDFTAPSEKQQALPKPNAEPSEAPNAEPTAEPTPKPTENPLSEAKQEGVQAAVKLGVPEQTAFDAFLAYQNMGKNKDESDGYSRNDEFREWLFKNVDSPEQMAVLEYQVIGQASSVKGAITYRDSGVVYRDYTNASWFKLSEHNLSKDGTNKRYEAGKQLEKTGMKVDKTVAIYDGLKELTKKAEWIDYLKNQNLTDDQIRIFLWSRGWKY